jgi:hypothetical protein
MKRGRNSHDREMNEHYVERVWCSRRLFEVETFASGVAGQTRESKPSW